MQFAQELTPDEICDAVISTNGLLFPDFEDVAKLIKLLDAAMEDYEFTQNMAKYFIAECIKCCDESEPFDINELMP